jgi:hypothetical protein
MEFEVNKWYKGEKDNKYINDTPMFNENRNFFLLIE